MHNRLLNEARIGLRIATVDPLLVRSGEIAVEGVDMAPVMTWRRGAKPEPYIPGSSLKGVLRSHSERIVRTLSYDQPSWRLGSCDPMLGNRKSKERCAGGSG